MSFSTVKLVSDLYEAFINHCNELEPGTLVFCEDNGKMFLKPPDETKSTMGIVEIPVILEDISEDNQE